MENKEILKLLFNTPNLDIKNFSLDKNDSEEFIFHLRFNMTDTEVLTGIIEKLKRIPQSKKYC